MAESKSDGAGGFILVAEDDVDARAAIRDALEYAGYSVLEAQNGREALSVVFAGSAVDVRLIITDLNMPEMSGSELMRILASYTRLSRIPILVVTGTSHVTWPRVGATACLEKPFDMEALLRLVALHVAPPPVIN